MRPGLTSATTYFQAFQAIPRRVRTSRGHNVTLVDVMLVSCSSSWSGADAPQGISVACPDRHDNPPVDSRRPDRVVHLPRRPLLHHREAVARASCGTVARDLRGRKERAVSLRPTAAILRHRDRNLRSPDRMGREPRDDQAPRGRRASDDALVTFPAEDASNAPRRTTDDRLPGRHALAFVLTRPLGGLLGSAFSKPCVREAASGPVRSFVGSRRAPRSRAPGPPAPRPRRNPGSRRPRGGSAAFAESRPAAGQGGQKKAHASPLSRPCASSTPSSASVGVEESAGRGRPVPERGGSAASAPQADQSDFKSPLYPIGGHESSLNWFRPSQSVQSHRSAFPDRRDGTSALPGS